MLHVAINGFGRIGRAAFRIMMDRDDMDVVAVNDLVPEENLAYLLKYDSVHGRYGKKVGLNEKGLIVEGETIPVLHEKEPENLPWKEMQVDAVLECTGVFTHRSDLMKHIAAGAGHVLLSAPAKSEDVETVVHGVNSEDTRSAQILSCASCTTNCITPVVEVVNRHLGVIKAAMTTIHAYTASQAIVDAPHRKMRRGRAGAANFVPTSTGAAVATTQVLPELKGRFDGAAVRGPVPAGSIADLVFLTRKKTTVDALQDIFRKEAESRRYQGILGVSEDPLVSSDIIGDARASIVDLGMMQVVDGDLVKIMSWYDNEWGYASQMVRQAAMLVQKA